MVTGSAAPLGKTTRPSFACRALDIRPNDKYHPLGPSTGTEQLHIKMRSVQDLRHPGGHSRKGHSGLHLNRHIAKAQLRERRLGRAVESARHGTRVLALLAPGPLSASVHCLRLAEANFAAPEAGGAQRHLVLHVAVSREKA